MRKDEPNVNEKDDELKYDDIKSPSTTKQLPPPCSTPYSSHKLRQKRDTSHKSQQSYKLYRLRVG